MKEFRLNRTSKHDVSIGDKLLFYPYTKEYLVLNVIKGNNNSVCLTIQDMKTKQVIYSYPSSQCYGALVIKE